MAINFEKINAGGISLMANFGYYGDKPLDSRLVIPSLEGLATLIENGAAYEGMIVYDQTTKKTYQVQTIEGVLSYREFGLTQAELEKIIMDSTTAAMEFKGATATLPENPAKGDMYKVAGENIDIKIDDVDAKLGDSIVYDGEKWFIIPSGDDIEDTWRPVDGVNNDATLKFVDGNMTGAVVAADGTIKFNHATVADPTLLAENEQTRTYITAVETDGYGHITGYKTATENVEDTNTEYTFESQVESSSVYFNVTPNTEGATEETIYVDAYSKNEADGKFVAKETGKSLVSDDEIARLAEVDNYDDEEVRGLIGDNAKAIEDLETYVGTIPTDEAYKDITNVISYVNKKAEETLAAASGNSTETAASVKQQLDNYKSENNTRVKTAEDAIDAIEADYLKAADKTELSNAIAAEQGRAEGIEAGLRTDVDVIKADYLKAADIANFETKENVQKVADDLAAEAEARANADSGFETRIAALEGKFTGDDSVDAKIAAAVLVEENARKEAVAGVQGEVDAVEGRLDTAEGKISALETASATHALKSDVEAEFAKYNTTEAQKAIDDAQDARIKAIENDYVVANDIANFETKENVAKVASDLAAYVESNNAAVADRYTKSEADDKFALKTDAYNDAEVRGLIADNAAAIATEKQRAEGIEGGLRTDVDAIKADYLKAADKTALQEQITANANAISVITNGIDAEKIDGLNDLIEWADEHAPEVKSIKEDIEANTEAIGNEVTRATGVEAGFETRIAALEAIDHNAYVAADTALKTELEGKLDAAKTEAVNQNAVVLSEAQKYTDTAKAAAIADAASKYETIGTAQGIVDGLKLSETYEPIGAEGRAIAAAKTETENQVKALADTLYTKAEVEALLTWGEF